MQRIKKISIANAQGKAKELLESTKKAMGTELNLFSTFANSPAALEAYIGIMTSLSKGALNPKLREQIALVSAGYNGCNYCASAHTYLGEKAGINKDELKENLSGKSSDKKTQVALNFATQLIERRGGVSESDIKTVREAGFSDEEMVEILAHVAMNTFTNYFNEAFKTDIDFPVVDTHKGRSAA